MINIEITTTFDFGKLEKKLPEILDSLVDESKDAFAEMSVKNIRDGLKPLRPKSILARQQGVYWGKQKVAPTTKTLPLDYTGSLIDSIKIHEQGVIMNKYGLYHNRGIGVPKRKFLALDTDIKNVKGTKYGKAQKNFIDTMYKRIHKALKA